MRAIWTRGCIATLAVLVQLTAPLATAASSPSLSGSDVGLPADEDIWMQTQKLTPGDAHELGILGNDAHWGVKFGSRVAIDGDTIVASTQMSSQGDSGWPANDGFDWAYVFHREADGEWRQTAKLVPDDAQKGDSFGSWVDVDESAGVIVVGNPAVREVYIFERADNGSWEQSAVVAKDIDGFGVTVAVSDDTFIAGAREDGLFVYERTPEGWQSASWLSEASAIADIQREKIATMVDSDGERIAIYEPDDGEWTRSALLPLADIHRSPSAKPTALAFSEDGSTVIAGAYLDRRAVGVQTGERTPGLPAVGSARIYEKEQGTWALKADLRNPDPAPVEKFGRSVGVSGDVAVVSAPGDVHNGGEAAGAAYVYQKGDGEWTLKQKLRNDDSTLSAGVGGDWFGETIDIAKGTIVVGAPFDDNRRDGTPYPANDWGDLPPCVGQNLVWGCEGSDDADCVRRDLVRGCDEGEDAGSVYTFDLLEKTSSLVHGDGEAGCRGCPSQASPTLWPVGRADGAIYPET